MTWQPIQIMAWQPIKKMAWQPIKNMAWQPINHKKKCMLHASYHLQGSVQHKVIVQSSTHPVISHVEHPIRLLLTPMLPPMRPSLILVDLPILVLVLPGCFSNTVCVETNTNGHTILPVSQLNLVIQPVNLFPLIDIVRARRGTGVREPG